MEPKELSPNVRRVYESMAPGGAFILVEKVLEATAKIDDAFVELFLNIKREKGYSNSRSTAADESVKS